MLWKVASVLPFWKSYYSYSGAAHRTALKKFSVLWLISISPLIFAAFVSPASDATPILRTFGTNFWQAFTGTHQFIYAVSFITPVIYLLYEHKERLLSHALSGKRTIKGVHLAPPGFDCVLFWSLCVFIFTLGAYVSSTTILQRGATTLLDQFSQDSAVYVYLFAIFCWYFTLLESTSAPKETFSHIKKGREEASKQAFHDRITGRDDSDD